MAQSHLDGNLPELFAPEFFLAADVERLKSSPGEARAAVLTRQQVLGFILDLAGATADKPLWKKRSREPSFGSGDFLLENLPAGFDFVVGNPPNGR